LLLQIGPARGLWRQVRDLMRDLDPRIAYLACKICQDHAPPA
jgi:hypothetical protein